MPHREERTAAAVIDQINQVDKEFQSFVEALRQAITSMNEYLHLAGGASGRCSEWSCRPEERGGWSTIHLREKCLL